MGATSYENNTNINQPSKSFGFEITLICVLIVTSIVGLIGNGLVIFLTGCRMKTTVNSIWFLNLAMADFIFILSFIMIPFTGYFLLYSSLSHILSIMITLNQFAGIFFLVVISLDRCLCTWMAVWAQNNRTVLRARIICIIVWVLAIGCIIPLIFVNELSGESNITFLVTYVFFVGFLIPFQIIASSYIAIGVRIKRLKMGKQLRSYRVIIAVVLAFFICCFPSYVCIFCLIKMDNSSASEREVLLKATKISFYLLYLNSALNPILYVFMCDEYKKKLKQSLLLVLETAFAEDHLDFSGRSTQKDTQNQTNSFELLDL